MLFQNFSYTLTPTLIILLILIGFGIGILGTLGGVGGGFLMVPLFLIMLYLEPAVAKGTSLFVIWMSSGVATYTHHRKKRLCWPILLKMSAVSIVGSIVCSIVQEEIVIEKTVFSLIFGIVEFLLAIQLMYQAREYFHKNHGKTESKIELPKPSDKEPLDSTDKKPGTIVEPSCPIATQAGSNSDNKISCEELNALLTNKAKLKKSIFLFFISGFLSTFLGIGGGVVNMPVLLGIMCVPIHYASASSTCILFITAFYNVIYYGLKGEIDWIMAIIVGAGMILGSRIAAVYMHKVPKIVLNVLLIVLLLYGGLRLIFPILT